MCDHDTGGESAADDVLDLTPYRLSTREEIVRDLGEAAVIAVALSCAIGACVGVWTEWLSLDWCWLLLIVSAVICIIMTPRALGFFE